MKKLIALALIVTMALAVTACGEVTVKKTSSPASEKTDTPVETSEKNDGKSYKLKLVSDSEMTENTFFVIYTIRDEDGNKTSTAVKATIKIVNDKGITVYDGPMTLGEQWGSSACIIDYSNVTPGATTYGTATVTLSAGASTVSESYQLNKLPYDLSDVKLPTVGTKVKQYGSSGDYYGESTLRSTNCEIKYINKDYVTLKVILVLERTTQGDLSSKSIGIHMKAVEGNGKVKYDDTTSGKIADDGKATITVSIEHVAGTGLTIDISDYK